MTTSAQEFQRSDLRIAWLPHHQLRLLWWLLVRPDQLLGYESLNGRQAVRAQAAWLVSSLLWLPLFIPTIAFAAALTRAVGAAPISLEPLLWFGGLLGGWALTGWLGQISEDTRAAVLIGAGLALVTLSANLVANVALTDWSRILLVSALVLAVSVAMSLEHVFAGGIALLLALLIAVQVAFVFGAIIALVSMGLIVTVTDLNLYHARASVFSYPVLMLLLLIYGALVWVFWFNGWRLL
ncbi:MAG: hypothetical protein GYB67_14560 [Chloroflexi bacterium]|nr:hypothetical protein [Chloroflexota bacterium]